MSELSKLPNVGKVLEQLLIDVGISTPEQLRETGVRETFVRIRMKDPTACIRMLMAFRVLSKESMINFFRTTRKKI